jgi:hypothetical protein
MVPKHRNNSKLRMQLLQGRRYGLGGYLLSAKNIAGHEIAEKDDKVSMLSVSSVDDGLELADADVRSPYVQITEYGQFEAASVLRPARDL